MEAKKLIKYLVLIISLISICTACNNKVKEINSNVELPKYSEVTVLKNLNNNFDAYQAKPDGLYKIGSQIGNISEMAYSTTGKSIAQAVVLSQGENLNNNFINIFRNNKLIVLNNYYCYQDLKMNNSGNFLAFRGYMEDSLDSAQGLKIFNIDTREIVNTKSKVLVSGNVYNWIDDNSILYYGIIPGKENSIKIYRYNLADKREEIYCENINGTCLFLLPVKEDVIYLKSQVESAEIDYFNYKNKSNTVVSTEISMIYNAKYNKLTDEVYFTGKADKDSSPALYKISMKTLKVSRITYNFPENIDINSDICIDALGNVFFTGSNAVFMYDYRDKSVNMISTSTGEYKLYGGVTN